MNPKTLEDLSNKTGVKILGLFHNKETKFVTVSFQYESVNLSSMIPEFLLSDKKENTRILKRYIQGSIANHLTK